MVQRRVARTVVGARYRIAVPARLATIAALLFAAATGATAASAADTTSAQPRVPILRQALRNNCETAALSMLLAAAGVRVAQLRLQAELPRNGPLDPVYRGGKTIWGDPRLGFVGRAAGGGTSGGYGVYEAPIRALAARHGVNLALLTGRPASVLYRRLADGRPILVWLGLSAGPYRTWTTPLGRLVNANFGEHTAVLTGLDGDRIRVNDPIDGLRKVWTREEFEQMWALLGRRAVGL